MYKVKHLHLSTEHTLVASIQDGDLVLSYATIIDDAYSEKRGIQVERTEVEELRIPAVALPDVINLLSDLEVENSLCAALSHG